MINDPQLIRFLVEGQTLIDVTGFFKEPSRSGILRVGWEMLRRWPKQILPVVIDEPGVIRLLPADTEYEMTAFFREPADIDDGIRRRFHGGKASYDRRIERLDYLLKYGSIPCNLTLALNACRAVVCYEVLFDDARIDGYLNLIAEDPDKFFIFTHDLLLWQDSSFFPHVDWAYTPQLLNYLRLLRKAVNTSANSIETAEAVSRLQKRPLEEIKVMALGADTFRAPTSTVRATPARFVVLGTIEPRKRSLLILEAAKRLSDAGRVLEVHVIGSLGWMPARDTARFRALVESESWITWHQGISDDEVAQLVAESSCCLYVSDYEGYGLPPLEALALGTPVICTEVPALQGINRGGVVALDKPTIEDIEAQLVRFLDPKFVNRFAKDVDINQLPKWATFAEAFAKWIETISKAPGCEHTVSVQLDRLFKLQTLSKGDFLRDGLSLLFAATGRKGTLVEAEEVTKLISDQDTLAEALLKIVMEYGPQVTPRQVLLMLNCLESDDLSSISPGIRKRQSNRTVSNQLLLSIYGYKGEDDFADYTIRKFVRAGSEALKAEFRSGRLKSDVVSSIVRSKECIDEGYHHFDMHDLEDALAVDRKIDRSVTEFLRLNNAEEFVERLYEHFLNRSSDVGGRNSYLARISAGIDRQVIIADILTSQEHLEHSDDKVGSLRAAVRLAGGLFISNQCAKE